MVTATAKQVPITDTATMWSDPMTEKVATMANIGEDPDEDLTDSNNIDEHEEKDFNEVIAAKVTAIMHKSQHGGIGGLAASFMNKSGIESR